MLHNTWNHFIINIIINIIVIITIIMVLLFFLYLCKVIILTTGPRFADNVLN